MSNFCGRFFHAFTGIIFFLKYCSVCTKQLHKKKVKKIKKFLKKIIMNFK
jgi:hypothetical protein